MEDKIANGRVFLDVKGERLEAEGEGEGDKEDGDEEGKESAEQT